MHNSKFKSYLITTTSYYLNMVFFSNKKYFLLDNAITLRLFISYEIDDINGFYFTRVILFSKEERVVCHQTSILSMKDRGRIPMIP